MTIATLRRSVKDIDIAVIIPYRSGRYVLSNKDVSCAKMQHSDFSPAP